MNNDWYLRSRRRYFLDFHIDDWDEKFLSQFDPEEFAEACLKGGATAATFMANTHTGLLNWPSRLGGRMHARFEGRDVLRETIDALHKRGLDAIVYYVFVYVADYWDKHPEARTVLADGRVVKNRISTEHGEHRFATCCINDPGYRRQALGELAELCDNYDFEGVWPDMTFWPAVCYCDNCRRRYRSETGRELPKVIDWKDPDFVRFVRKRQQWLLEFCREVTQTIKSRKPGMKLAQQSQTFTWDWMAGASAELADCWDWMSADLYCDRYGLSYSSKLFYALSTCKPFERVNCWNVPNIHEHVISRTEDELQQIAWSTIMNDGALTIIDQVDPVGTVHLHNYEVMSRVFARMKPYEQYLGGRFVQDVGIYYSFYSNIDQTWNGRPVAEAGATFEFGKDNPSYQDGTSHMKCAANAAKTLTWCHIPYGIVTKKNLKELSDYRVLVVNNCAMLDEEECAAIRAFVRNGGCLYLSGETATIRTDGTPEMAGYLSDLTGTAFEGWLGDLTTYVSPTEAGSELFPDAFSARFPVTVKAPQKKLRLLAEDCTVLGTVTLPDVYPAEDRHASILTTPPGRYTDAPSLIEHAFGKGRVIYSAALLEMGTHVSQREVFARVIRRLCGACCTELDGTPTVEITRFEKNDGTYLHLLNYQAELPNVPIYDLRFRAAADRPVHHVELLPNGELLPFALRDGYCEISLHELRDYALVHIVYA